MRTKVLNKGWHWGEDWIFSHLSWFHLCHATNYNLICIKVRDFRCCAFFMLSASLGMSNEQFWIACCTYYLCYLYVILYVWTNFMDAASIYLEKFCFIVDTNNENESWLNALSMRWYCCYNVCGCSLANCNNNLACFTTPIFDIFSTVLSLAAASNSNPIL